MFSAFFSGMEIAFLSANKLKIELSYQRGTFSGKIINDFVKNPSKFIITVLLGNNVVLIAFGILFANMLEPVLANYISAPFVVLLIQTIVSTTLVLLIGEYLPKVMFKVFADDLLPILAFPFKLIYWVLLPGVFLINLISKFILKIFGVAVTEKSIEFTNIDLEKFIKEHTLSNHEDEEVDKVFFENALDLKNLKVRDCMVPRREITAIDVHDTIDDLKKLIISTNHSRILVYDDNIDKIVGYVHHFDLHKRSNDIRSILMPIKVVTMTMHIQKLLNDMIKEQKSIAWVVDEYGGTAGVITLEDILEEIFGEIDDEHDKAEFVENQLSKNEYILSGRLEISHINKEFNLDIPEGEYDTLSGFIIAHHETIPEKNEIIEIDKFKFKIMDVSETKIETTKLEVLPKE
jgi:CBS domain containing-hemolysin-like protein